MTARVSAEVDGGSCGGVRNGQILGPCGRQRQLDFLIVWMYDIRGRDGIEMALRMCPSKWKDGGAVNQTEGWAREGKAEEDRESAMPTRHLRRDVQSSSGHRRLEVRAEVRAGNSHLRSVRKGTAFKVIGQDELNHGMMIK